MIRAAVVAVLAMALAAPAAHAGDKDEALYQVGVIFARDRSLWRTDARGKGPPTEVVALPGPAKDVRALRTDAAGKVLLVDYAGTWHWMPLDGHARALTKLPCAGAITIAPDGACVVCATARGQVSIVHLASGAQSTVAVPATGATIVGAGSDRRLLWSDRGVWSAPLDEMSAKRKVSPASPVRSLSISPDGKRAFGVYAGTVHEGKTEATAEVMYGFALDGTAARRRAIRDAVPLVWSHDAQWLLAQDGTSACIMRGVGGQNKCWKGFTAVSIAPDGSWALVLGPRSSSSSSDKDRKDRDRRRDDDESEGSDDEEASEAATGPMSLYRARLGSAHADRPTLVERIVDGPAVWLP